MKRLGEGWDHQVFEVEGGWIFRFPKRQGVRAALGRERAVLPRLGSCLPVRVPLFEYVGEPTRAFPSEFVGYRKLEGTPLQSLPRPLPPSRKSRLARQLGEFLSVLHAVDHRRLGIELPRASRTLVSEPLGDAAQNVAVLAEVAPQLSRRLERWLRDVRPASAPMDADVFTHGDFDVEHMLLDAHDETLAAVIDWGNAELAPPMADFVGIYGFGGARFLEQVLTSYRGAVGPAHVHWLVQRQVHVGLRSITYGLSARQPAFVNAGLRGLAHALA